MASLTTLTWLSLYKDKPLDDQVKQLEEIMEQLGIARIDLKDKVENEPYTISLNETIHFVGTHSSFANYIPLNIILRAQKIINRLVINSYIQQLTTDYCVIFSDNYTEIGAHNRPFILNELLSLNITEILVVVDNKEIFLYDILINENLYQRFIDDWKMDVVMVVSEEYFLNGREDDNQNQ